MRHSEKGGILELARGPSFIIFLSVLCGLDMARGVIETNGEH